MTKAWWLVIVAACGKPDSGDSPANRPAREPSTTPAPPPPPPPAAPKETDEPAVPKVDTTAWNTVRISKLGTDKFAFDGTLRVPPGTKTSTTGVYTSDKKLTGLMAYVTLPGGVKLMMSQRTRESEKDPTMLKSLIASQGPFVIDRRTPTGYMLVLRRDDGFVVQGAMWPVEPGLDCATEDALTLPQLAETLAVCDSFAGK